jgi:putative intracellular protease/amidase
MNVKVDTSINEVSKLDILVIPGGAAETYLMSKDTTILNWIKQIDKTTFYTTSVCTGSWILGATGLLNGKNATTNWYRAEEMLNKYGATFIDARWVQDGKYWTSAGVTAGIDMSLAIINDLMGPQFTQATMLNLEYNPGPPVTGGSPKNTDPVVTEMMLEMYDMGLKPLMDKDKKKKTPVFEQWPALDEYHKIMSKTFHPAEEGNLEPTKTNAAELAVKAKLLSQSDIPESFTKQGMTGIVEKLEKESAALAKMVNDKKSDAELTKAIFALHDRFHEIMGKCRE